jgi:hypothetical protein
MANEGFDKQAAQSLADSLNLSRQAENHNSTANNLGSLLLDGQAKSSTTDRYLKLADEANKNATQLEQSLTDLSGPLSSTLIDLTVGCINFMTSECQMTAKILDEHTGTQEQLIIEARNSILEANDTLNEALAIEINASVAVSEHRQNLSSLLSVVNETVKLQNGVKDTISWIKQSLSRARQIINQVRSARHFAQGSLAVFEDKTVRSNATGLSLFFQSDRTDGLLLYVGDKTASMNQSFVALEIVAHRVWFKYNLGGVTAAIRNSHMIVVGQWYQVWAQRVGHVGNVTVIGPDNQVTMAYGQSSAGHVDLLLTEPVVTVGGRFGVVSSEVVSRDFVGCLDNITIDHQLLDLTNPSSATPGISVCDCNRTIPSVPSESPTATQPTITPTTREIQRTSETPDISSKAQPTTSKPVTSGTPVTAGTTSVPGMTSVPGTTSVLGTTSLPGTTSVPVTNATEDMTSGPITTTAPDMTSPSTFEPATTVASLKPATTREPSRSQAVSVTSEPLTTVAPGTTSVPVENVTSSEMPEMTSEPITTTAPVTTSIPVSTEEFLTTTTTTTEPPLGTTSETVTTSVPATTKEAVTTETTPMTTSKAATTTVSPNVITVPSTLPTTDIPTTMVPSTTPSPTTTTSSPAPLTSCAVPSTPGFSSVGMRTAHLSSSYLAYSFTSDYFYRRFHAELEFRTFDSEGVLFFITDDNAKDFIGLEMRNGYIRFAFDCGGGIASNTTTNTYNDGLWHTVIFGRLDTVGFLTVDFDKDFELVIAADTFVSVSTDNNLLYIGGIPYGFQPKGLMMTDEDSRPGILACFRKMSLKGTDFLTSSKLQETNNTDHCYSNIGPGASYDGTGYFSLFDSEIEGWRAGTDFEINLEFRTTNDTGLLFYVENKGDILDHIQLELVNGTVVFAFNNGGRNGDVNIEWVPPFPYYLCDEKWHTISVSKRGIAGNLTVDNMDTKIGTSTITTLTGVNVIAPLYFGGVPDTVEKRDGKDAVSFVGCLRNIFFKHDTRTTLTPSYRHETARFVGVKPDGCPE